VFAVARNLLGRDGAMRLRLLALALAVLAGLAVPASAAGGGSNKPARRLGAAYAKRRAATPAPRPVVVPVASGASRMRSAGMSCRSSAKG
jgi:hypothetical protein